MKQTELKLFIAGLIAYIQPEYTTDTREIIKKPADSALHCSAGGNNVVLIH